MLKHLIFHATTKTLPSACIPSIQASAVDALLCSGPSPQNIGAGNGESPRGGLRFSMVFLGDLVHICTMVKLHRISWDHEWIMDEWINWDFMFFYSHRTRINVHLRHLQLLSAGACYMRLRFRGNPPSPNGAVFSRNPSADPFPRCFTPQKPWSNGGCREGNHTKLRAQLSHGLHLCLFRYLGEWCWWLNKAMHIQFGLVEIGISA